MTNSRRRIWYDITMALTFPSVLGAVIYSMLDTGMRESFSNALVAVNLLSPEDIITPGGPQPSLLNALGLSPKICLTVYLLITFFVAVQYPATTYTRSTSKLIILVNTFFMTSLSQVRLRVAVVCKRLLGSVRSSHSHTTIRITTTSLTRIILSQKMLDTISGPALYKTPCA